MTGRDYVVKFVNQNDDSNHLVVTARSGLMAMKKAIMRKDVERKYGPWETLKYEEIE